MQLAFAGRFSVLCAALLLGSCASTPSQNPTSAIEQRNQDIAAGAALASQLETHLRFKQDRAVDSFLRHLASALLSGAPALSGGEEPALRLIHDLDSRWRNLGLPGNRIYLSVGLVKRLEFENELAAAVALQFGHLARRDPESRIEQLKADAPDTPPEKLRYFGEQGIFSYTDEMEAVAASDAVGILYRSGYDPRGVISLLEIYRTNPAKSPYGGAALEKMIESARATIAQNAPLRNPVIRSQAFLEIHKRIQRL
ncbi:MAG: hypothetical protein ACXWP5_05920 [Bdellovibrionota bacterium]